MNPKIWGPSAWIFLHSVTFNYPDNPTEEIKNKYKVFFESLQFVLPCEKCQNNYKKKLVKYELSPEVLKNKKVLIEWLIDIHNEVNKKNGKRIYSYEEVEKIYKDMYTMKNNNIIVNNEINWNTILIIIVIILIGYFLYKEYS